MLLGPSRLLYGFLFTGQLFVIFSRGLGLLHSLIHRDRRTVLSNRLETEVLSLGTGAVQ